MKKTIEFNLLGKSYKIKVSENIKNIDELISYFIKEVEKTYFSDKNKNDVQTMILVCLNILNNFIKLQKEHKELKENLNSNSLNLIDLIDNKIKEN